ncbi:MAG: Na+/H+ antiporter NhaC family protein [Akkermansiaceae bacterium]
MRNISFITLLVLIAVLTVVLQLTQAGVLAIWPSIVALVLVFSTRNVLLGLLGGAVVGSVILMDGALYKVPMDLAHHHLLPNFESSWKSGAIVFTLILGGFVSLLEKGGTLQVFLARLLAGRSPRRVEAGAGVFGLVCFFDGLANSLIVGKIFQPLARAASVPKVRLAYIVDTTSSAVACLAFISTWIAFQLSMIREGFILAGKEDLAEPYYLFFQSLPHNFYAWFALILLAVVVWKQWDIGPMKRFREEVSPSKAVKFDDLADGRGIWRAWVPLLALLLGVFGGIYADGTKAMEVPMLPLSWERLAMSFAEANITAVLIAASGLASLLAWMFFPRDVEVDGKRVVAGAVFVEGMVQMFKPVLILVMAWMLSSTLNELKAADFLGELLSGAVAAPMFPTIVFVTGSLIAFTTGTSWGTMGILMPLAIPLVFTITDGDQAMAMNLIPVVIGATFSGAVFGDHCSPMSDTTIVSSIACDTDPMDHVRTQMPYALIAAVAAAVVGFPISGISEGSPSWAFFSAALFVFLLLIFRFVSQRVWSKSER